MKGVILNEQTPQVDKWILSYPGGPAGPFWGIVTQSGKVIALQIIEREHAESLLIIGNVLGGHLATVRKVAERLTLIFSETLDVETMLGNDEGYFINSVIEAVLGLAKDTMSEEGDCYILPEEG